MLTCALLVLVSGRAPTAEQVDLAGATIVVGEQATDMEVFAARELSRYFRLIGGKDSPVVVGLESLGPDQGPGVIVGTQDSLPGANLPSVQGDQAYLLQVTSTEPPRLLVSGTRPIGVQYGVYSLLEKLGVGFYLGGDALPALREKLLLPADLNETRSPVFRTRGSLPWYNFLNSPTTWDLEDYQFFFDQMAKQKMNFVGFHSYDHEPFCAYPWEGEWRMGQPAATSMTYGWGTVRHLKTDDFGLGTGRHFPYDVFGSRSATLAEEPAEPTPEGAIFPHRTARDDAIIRAQCVLAQGLQYASRRGINVCVGFELNGDPTDAELRRQTEARIRHMLATYPMLSYVWFWQQEGRGGGADAPAPDSPLDLIVQRYRPTFQYLGKEGRIAEAARMTAWVQFAHRVVRCFRPNLRVIVSGWGGDKWMRFTDFYLGLDKVLPEDIIFAALDNIDPTAEPNVSAVYGQLSPEREKWPIPWFESDGGGTRRDQWGPQCNVKPFTELVRDAREKGCQGILGIHWQTRGIEEVAAYVAQSAWNPELTYEQFYADFARKCYGEEHGPRMAQLHMQLESLGPRWTGGAGQVECGRFSWFSNPDRPKPENLEQLQTIGDRLKQLRTPTYTAWERRNYLQATIEFLLAFDEAALTLAPDGPVEQLLQQAETAKAAGNESATKESAEQALAQMAACSLPQAMETYTTRLTTQGDWGNLATINVKAYAAFLALWERAEAVLGEDRPLPEAPHSAPPVFVKAVPSAAPESVSLPVYAIAPWSRAASKHRLLYRVRGKQAPKSVAMDQAGRTLFVASIPAVDIGPEGLELQVQAYLTAPFPGELAKPLTFWPDEGAWHSVSVFPASGPAVYGPYVHSDVAMAPWPVPEGASAALRTTVSPATEYEECMVEARLNGAVHRGTALYHLGILPLPPAILEQAKLRATCRATDGQGRRGVASATFQAPAEPPPTPDSLSAEMAGPFLARLSWDDVPCAHFEVHRSVKHPFTPTDETLLAQWPWTIFDDIVTPNTTYHYAVIAVDDAGQRSEPAFSRSLSVGDFPLARAPEGVTATPGPGRVTLTWEKSPEPVKGYAVLMLVGGDVWHRASGEAPVVPTQFIVGGLDEQTERRFQVRCVDRGGRLGEPSAEVTATPLPVPREPVFATGFGDAKAETGQQGKLAGKAALANGLLDVSDGGWIAYPQEDMLQLSGPLTVEFWANIDRIEGIPVMLSFGHWEGPGYWVQLIGGMIRWYLPMQKILDVPAPSTGEWHHICCTYDGLVSRVYVDGKEVGSKEIGPIDLTPWHGELRVGQYSDIDDQFQTLGQIDEVRIYQRALSAGEVARSFGDGR